MAPAVTLPPGGTPEGPCRSRPAPPLNGRAAPARAGSPDARPAPGARRGPCPPPATARPWPRRRGGLDRPWPRRAAAPTRPPHPGQWPRSAGATARRVPARARRPRSTSQASTPDVPLTRRSLSRRPRAPRHLRDPCHPTTSAPPTRTPTAPFPDSPPQPQATALPRPLRAASRPPRRTQVVAEPSRGGGGSGTVRRAGRGIRGGWESSGHPRTFRRWDSRATPALPSPRSARLRRSGRVYPSLPIRMRRATGNLPLMG